MNTPVYPFETDPNDHCETSKEAYEDISNLLEILAIEMNKSKETLRIYDPYYCEGRVIERLRSLGFQSVYNKNEDFYAVCKSNNCPEFDCIVTNPPYSADHMEILLKFCLLSLKPWFLLLPNFVYTKEYYIKRILLKKVLLDMIYYVIPMNRYRYTTPKVNYYLHLCLSLIDISVGAKTKKELKIYFTIRIVLVL
jgi:hypothetical protein